MLQSEHDKIAIPIINGFDFVLFSDIIRLQSEGNYCNFFLTGKKQFQTSHHLKFFEPKLLANGFMRVHESNIINIVYVKRYIRGDGGYVIMEDGSKADVSRSHKAELLEVLMRRSGCPALINRIINHLH